MNTKKLKFVLLHPIKYVFDSIRAIFHEEIRILHEEIKNQSINICELKRNNELLQENNMLLHNRLDELNDMIGRLVQQMDVMQNAIVQHNNYSQTIPKTMTGEFNKILATDRKNLTYQLTRISSMQTADYILNNMFKVRKFSKTEDLWSYALENVNLEGLYCEFGVYQGKSINYLSGHKPEVKFYGFDSWEGLPEDWRTGYSKGEFKCDLPTVNQNVELYKGYFDETLPLFIKEHVQICAFIHVDCDLYSSAKVIFDFLKDRIKAGTIILFDEYFNYPGWKQGEFKAFQEFVEENNVKYEYIAYRDVHEQALVRILEIN